MSSALNKLAIKIASDPKKALAAVPVLIETAAAVAPVAIVGAAGYGIYRFIKWVKE